jgi:hypothetical protein
VKLNTHVHLEPRLRMVELYLHSPIRLHSMVLNELDTDTNLVLPGSMSVCVPAILSEGFVFFLSLSRKMLG